MDKNLCYPFFFFREAILRTAKTLVEDTKSLVASAQASQDVLASAAQSAVGSVSSLADNVKLGAIALGSDDSDAQVESSIQCIVFPLLLYVTFTWTASGPFFFPPTSRKGQHLMKAAREAFAHIT